MKSNSALALTLSLILITGLTTAQKTNSKNPSAPNINSEILDQSFNLESIPVNQNSSGSVTLKGQINFHTSGYRLKTSSKDGQNVKTNVSIKSLSDNSTTPQNISETDSGNYTANLEIEMDRKQVKPQREGIDLQDTRPSTPEEPELSENHELENKSREQLISMVTDLREKVERLRSQQLRVTEAKNHNATESNSTENKQKNQTAPEGEKPVENNQSTQYRIKNESNSDRNKSKEDTEIEDRPKTVENQTQKPGFVTGFINSIFK